MYSFSPFDNFKKELKEIVLFIPYILTYIYDSKDKQDVR